VNPVKKIRAFIALKPPPEWTEQLGRVQDNLQKELRSPAIKWVQPQQIHITLRFFGYILLEQVDPIVAAMNKIAAQTEAFTLSARGLGCFPSTRTPRVLWVGVEDRCVVELQEQITTATRMVGQEPEDRPFSPHLTLARIKDLPREEGKVLERVHKISLSPEWQVTELLLMQSHLSPEGARYEVVHSARLSGKQ